MKIPKGKKLSREAQREIRDFANRISDIVYDETLDTWRGLENEAIAVATAAEKTTIRVLASRLAHDAAETPSKRK